jgi:hypothetical protein
MIETGFNNRVKVNQIIESQIPEFLLSESPKLSEFLKQYYVSQEFPGGPVDIAENLDQYLKLDNLTPEVIVGKTTLISDISESSDTITVSSTKGFPSQYGLFKINEEIITYTGISGNSFIGCIRGFSGITSYDGNSRGELVFESTSRSSHLSGSDVINLSSLFLKEFYKKIKSYLTPGLEDSDFVSNLNVSNFIKESRKFYQSKGTEESFKILFKVLYGETPKVIDLETLLIKPSVANYSRREVVIAERIFGDPINLIGQTIRKSEDASITASISEAEIITRRNKTYYKLSLFVALNDAELFDEKFSVNGKTKVLENINIGSTVISVDSTIGFPSEGVLISEGNIITYTEKTINQFLNCSGIEFPIPVASDIRSDEYVYGYENGDLKKEVRLRITGVLSDFEATSKINLIDEGEIISVKNLGQVIENPRVNKTHKEIFTNSWIYNTSSRYQVSRFFGSSFVLSSSIDKSSLKIGDRVDILVRGSQEIRAENGIVTNIDVTTNEVTVSNFTTSNLISSGLYDLRRRIEKASSSGATIKYGNNNIIANIQNVYVENDEYGYVTSNSLPSYNITKNISIATISSATEPRIQGLDLENQTYSIISFENNAPFSTGDSIVYEAENEEIPGLINGGLYFVEVLGLPNQIRLFNSRSFIGTNEFVRFGASNIPGSHSFVLESNRQKVISPQKILRKFPLTQDLQREEIGKETLPGPIGILINGVEIINYKSDDKIFYGPIEELNVINGGSDYDVINPPVLDISSPENSENKALGTVVVRGNLKEVFVDPQDFDLNTVVSATLDGGNGSGAILDPIISRRFRELEFDARSFIDGGGLDLGQETITFTKEHRITDGEPIVYNENGNLPLGIGSFGPPDFENNAPTNKTLINGSRYYPKVINSKTIQLYETFNDYFVGINTIGITKENNNGIHKFRTAEKNTLRSIKVLNSGSNYENRRLIVKSVGISTLNHTINFPDHKLRDGDIVEYSTDLASSPIVGLSTEVNYKVLKVNEDTFRLANVGIGTNNDENYLRRNYERFETTGSGYHIFKYPDIKVIVNVSYGSTLIGSINATPVVKGEIVDTYLYENGMGYGSKIVNLPRLPRISLITGSRAEVNVIVRFGTIIKVDVLSGGSDYNSTPNLVINGNGSGAVLRPIVRNKRLVEVIVINGGFGYDENTTVTVSPSGQGASISARIRALTLNKFNKFGNEILEESINDGLEYGIVGYSTDVVGIFFGDDGSDHSPIIGWAYDGNPIYGPYGYSNPENIGSPLKLMQTGYSLRPDLVEDRPSDIQSGFFIDDYKFSSSGDLDIFNGRYCKTPDFPNGVYAYFVGITTDTSSNSLIPSFPYFIGNKFRLPEIENSKLLTQEFDFNSSNLIRNTFPYKVNDPFADNDFLIEPNEVTNQLTKIESVSKGVVDSITILNPGEGYRVGESFAFDNTGTNGGGLNAQISWITGRPINQIKTNIKEYNNTIFVWKDGENVEAFYDPFHEILDGDSVVVSGLSTSVKNLTGSKRVGVISDSIILFNDMPPNIGVDAAEDIAVSNIPKSVSVGSTITIDGEVLKVLNIFSDKSLLRVKRSDVGSAHTASSRISILPNSFVIPVKTSFFNSKLNDKVYFNPNQSVGIGTSIGVGVGLNYVIGGITNEISVPTQSIYLPNHPFKTGQKVIFKKNPQSLTISVSETPDSPQFVIPQTGNESELFVINKSKDIIGLTTSVGLTTNTQGLFYQSNGSNVFEYLIESDYEQVTGESRKIESTIALIGEHDLNNGDTVKLNVKPALTVGIGESSSVRVKYDDKFNRVLINSIGFTSSRIDTQNNIISLDSHGLNTGDKVLYDFIFDPIDGLVNGEYYVYRIDDDNIQLAQTLNDSIQTPPIIISLDDVVTDGHTISLINPRIKVRNNNNIKFDLSDLSLSGKEFKLFYDSGFNSEFVSTGDTSSFNKSGIGTIGLDGASYILNYSNGIPDKLYYSVGQDGIFIQPDSEVKNFSEILFVNSTYSGSFTITGTASTTFNISLKEVPEKNIYVQSECDELNYSTNSRSANGGINEIKIISPGQNYKKIPTFERVNSESGVNGNVICESDSIGEISRIRILDQGYEYSSDKTLRPEAYISPILSIENSNTITSVNIIDPGKNYSTPPDLVIFDPSSNKVVDTDSLICNVYSNSISSVEVSVPKYGLSQTTHKIFAINNSNGVAISSVTSSPGGLVNCTLSTPITGFSTNIFEVGDEIFVEGIEKEGESGTGFNSADYNFSFFSITQYINSNPAIVQFDLSGFTVNPGLAKTNQIAFASIINRKNYPVFQVIQDFAIFKIGEKLFTNTGSGFIERDLFIKDARKEYIKVDGLYSLSVGERIKGINSGVIATISKITPNTGRFDVEYSLVQDFGWLDEVGKLNETNQVSPDNDYYQNLSYTIKSSIEYETLINPVNRLLHISGLKNFADTQIESNASSNYTSSTIDLIRIDVIEEKRVDTINNYDLTLDINTFENKSKFLQLKNRKLSSYIDCITNRVVKIDDVNSIFSNKESDNRPPFTDIVSLNDNFSSYLIQIRDPNSTKIELLEVVVLNDDTSVLTLDKGLIGNDEKSFGDISGIIDTFDNKTLRFFPKDIFNTDYDIKVIENIFNSFISGVGTENIGSISLVGINTIISRNGSDKIISVPANTSKYLYGAIHVLNLNTRKSNYVELFAQHDGSDVYLGEFYFDSSQGITTGAMGSFRSYLDNGSLIIDYENFEQSDLLIRSKFVEFKDQPLGISTFRFIIDGQIPGNERSAYFTSNYITSSSETKVIGIEFSVARSLKSIIRVSYGQTSSLHQVLMVCDENDTYTVNYPHLSIGSTSGIGTFGGEFDGDQAVLKFYPDPEVNGSFELQSYNQILYTENDNINFAPSFKYGTVTENIILSAFDSINGKRSNRLDFETTSDGLPIFLKTFNPKNTSNLDPVSGTFTINDHLFSNLEEIIYTPNSTFIGVGKVPLGIGLTENYLGISTDILPSKLYVIKINNNQFKLATKEEYASLGIAVTFTSLGEGNAHELEMSKKLEKSIISIDGIVQKPITYTPINYILENNGGGITDSAEIFAISGISTIRPNDLFKIDDEYANVLSVGFGTTSSGPITGIGSIPLARVVRGFVGSISTSHTDGTEVRIYRGAFNISKNKIFFTEAPKGAGREIVGNDNIRVPSSSFSGRVYLRNDYSTNVIYDDIEDTFSGIGQTYSLSVQGINTAGIETGNGILFINNVFQTPSTENNLGQNYFFEESIDGTNVVFTGITSFNGQLIRSESDVNQNQLPRGGIIISLGSTPGLGYAPLVGASVTAVVDPSDGSIVSVGLGTEDIPGSGYRGIVSIGITESGHIGSEAIISASVGAGGALEFFVSYGGTGYSNPTIEVPDPSYSNLPVEGIFRRGIGNTTETGSNLLITLEVGASSTTGIGSTLFEVSSFKISRPGYGFEIGDIFKPIGLVTDRNLIEPLENFELTVLDVFTDSFTSWQFGELDYIDSTDNLQDGIRTRFPLIYKGRLISFETDSVEIDLNSVLLIFVNGVIQEPGVAYQFEGGTSINFSDPLKPEDQVAIFFYRGTREDDSILVDVNETIKIGDIVEVLSSDTDPSITRQDPRRVDNILASDTIETNLYRGFGINESVYRPLSWTKQKIDNFINGDIVYKTRDSIEPQIYPTSRIIKSIDSGSTEIFLDNAESFKYEQVNYSIPVLRVGALIIDNNNPVSAALTAVVSTGGTIQELVLTNPGFGYTGSSVTIKISSPKIIGSGIGTVAEGTAQIVDGSLTNPVVVNPGLGYNQDSPPQVIAPFPEFKYEYIDEITGIEGFSGIVTGITTTFGLGGNSLALKIYINSQSNFIGLNTGYPIYIYDTSVGTGLTTIDQNDSDIVGIGTEFVNNIYIIHSIDVFGPNAEIISNIDSNSNTVGISTNSDFAGYFSWGRLSGIDREIPISLDISGFTIDPTLSSFPTIQRRNFGFRETGAIRKLL